MMFFYGLSRLKLFIACFGAQPNIVGRVWFRGLGRLSIGENSMLDARQCPIELYVKAEGRLQIGEDVTIASGSSIEATHSVTLGRGCQIGMYCKILDTNWHSLRQRDQVPRPVPIEVGENVVLEDHVILLPGARIGDNVTVRAHSVVSRAIPCDVVVSGYPARIVERRRAP
ncbi:acetyltransferase-like isoleucine patch superfamily enzyme [Rhodoblastus acidophilus]|uniref:acyltransferase n=1 Tax=Rhodoblastus acidophilus TaxID=1074 RepID=UPI00222589BD|nr:acyltransferase [Rhodoblastus acidophilus]MCW2285936.1 acetyltransferase-like isoleucine patch superfamily enzyme [Rhodoblastus acidophilus]MCW2334830.1 acetyltransferase-like isoleucine patch superfamily enzyme [Rhodoblastus acidophilus]